MAEVLPNVLSARPNVEPYFMGNVKGIGLWLLGLSCVLFFTAPEAGAQMRTWTSTDQSRPPKKYTKIWGQDGELWDPDDDTLLDFSYAGHHEGKNDFPQWKIGVDVLDFGALGDGEADDTEAFRKAVEACPDAAVVFIPNGTYRLMDWIRVEETTDLAFRGESRDGTVLLLGVGLEEIHPKESKTGHGRPTTHWSWSGGFLWFQDCLEVGVENLTVQGGGKQYDVHWKERGYNGIFFHNVADGWVRNVTLCNVDSGILTDESRHVTVRDVLFESTSQWPSTSQFEDNFGVSGHHGISFGHASSWCVADKIVFTNRFHHELGVSGASHQCVYSNARGPNLHFDFHTQEVEHQGKRPLPAGREAVAKTPGAGGRSEDPSRRLADRVARSAGKGPSLVRRLYARANRAPEHLSRSARRRLAGTTQSAVQPKVPKADVTTDPSESTNDKRHWLPLSSWTLLALVLICAVPCGWFAVKKLRRTLPSPRIRR